MLRRLRGHGITVLACCGRGLGNVLMNGKVSITLETVLAEYTLRLGFSRGQIQPYAGEVLYSKEKKVRLINRKTGSDEANFYHHEENSIGENFFDFSRKTCSDAIYAREQAYAVRRFQFTKSTQLRSFFSFSLY